MLMLLISDITLMNSELTFNLKAYACHMDYLPWPWCSLRARLSLRFAARASEVFCPFAKVLTFEQALPAFSLIWFCLEERWWPPCIFPLSRTKNEAEQRREAAGRRSKNRDSFRGALKIEDERGRRRGRLACSPDSVYWITQERGQAHIMVNRVFTLILDS